MKRLILFATLIASSGVLLTNVYNSVVDAQSWGSNIPYSIEAARNYFKTVNPGTFYRAASPMVQLPALVSLVINWKSFRNLRWYLVASLLVFVLADMLTFVYFYPRNDIMFSGASLTDIQTLAKTHQEWASMNWFRSVTVFIGVVLTSVALHKSYVLTPAQARDAATKFNQKSRLAQA